MESSITRWYSYCKYVAPATSETNAAIEGEEATFVVNIAPALSGLANVQSVDLELNLYTKTSLGDGKMANNPWLQELPDPITRTSWDNYITMSAPDAKKYDLEHWTVSNGALDGNLVNITVNGVTVENVPVYIQPGQAQGSIGLALGYGRTNGVNENMKVGVDAYPLYQNFSTNQPVTIEKVAGRHEFCMCSVTTYLNG